jgi:hypothetical protein
MKRLFGDRFTFALLDDVVMSVDARHPIWEHPVQAAGTHGKPASQT